MKHAAADLEHTALHHDLVIAEIYAKLNRIEDAAERFRIGVTERSDRVEGRLSTDLTVLSARVTGDRDSVGAHLSGVHSALTELERDLGALSAHLQHLDRHLDRMDGSFTAVLRNLHDQT